MREDERRERGSERGKRDSQFLFFSRAGSANGESELGHSNADLLMQVEERAEAELMMVS
jgi:hypothetical protein